MADIYSSEQEVMRTVLLAFDDNPEEPREQSDVPFADIHASYLLALLEQFDQATRFRVCTYYVLLPVAAEMTLREDAVEDNDNESRHFVIIRENDEGLGRISTLFRDCIRMTAGDKNLPGSLFKQYIEVGLRDLFSECDTTENLSAYKDVEIASYKIRSSAHRLAARLYEMGVLESPLLCADILRAAFETEHFFDDDERWVYFEAIICWIHVEGPLRLKEWIGRGMTTRDPFTRGPLYDGEETLDKKRWNWWCKTVKEWAEKEEKDDVRSFAETMQEFEEGFEEEVQN